jgi:anhydro-N-acetylmuramic acid kinase
MQSTYHIIGLMSGTSLDGLDIAYCRFDLKDGLWKFEIIEATTVKYPKAWINKFMAAKEMTAVDFARLNVDFGHYIGKSVRRFMNSHKIKVDLIASHGQTIMHQPKIKLTFQIGSGAAIAAETGATVVCDFRTTDIAMGGQGAPLVPIGDELLFGDFGACLNIGGFANLSYNIRGNRIAYDICPANTILNFLARKSGKAYDRNGKMAENGNISDELLNELNRIDFYKQKPPKSLGIERLVNIILPLNNFSNLSVADRLRTLTEHIAMQIAHAIEQSRAKNILSTGGGTHNYFLVKRIKDLSGNKLVIPRKEIIDYKEALIFAFLGVLRLRNETNCLKSATGARRNSCGGAIYKG